MLIPSSLLTPSISITFIKINEPINTLLVIAHSLLGLTILDFDKCIMTCTHQYVYM